VLQILLDPKPTEFAVDACVTHIREKSEDAAQRTPI
jgi:hypothetical protein